MLVPRIVQVTVQNALKTSEAFSAAFGAEATSVQACLAEVVPGCTAEREGSAQVVTFAGHDPDALGLRLVELNPEPMKAAKEGRPTHSPGPFGFSVRSVQLQVAVSVLEAAGGQALHDAVKFEGSVESGRGVLEVVVLMPEGYCVTIMEPLDSAARQERASVRSYSIVSADVAKTDAFWGGPAGLRRQTITDGLDAGWGQVRGIPPHLHIDTATFRADYGGSVYRAWVPALGEGRQPLGATCDALGALVLDVDVVESEHGAPPAIINGALQEVGSTFAPVFLAPDGVTLTSSSHRPGGFLSSGT